MPDVEPNAGEKLVLVVKNTAQNLKPDQEVTKRCPNRPKSDQNMVTTKF
jgi:hypothetical protein